MRRYNIRVPSVNLYKLLHSVHLRAHTARLFGNEELAGYYIAYAAAINLKLYGSKSAFAHGW